MRKQRKDGESFRQDREWHTMDLPDIDDVKTLAQQHEYQRLLRKRWEECEVPSDLPFAPENAPWWQFPYGIDPAAIAQQQLRKLRRER
jgi:hypothetical protein